MPKVKDGRLLPFYVYIIYTFENDYFNDISFRRVKKTNSQMNQRKKNNVFVILNGERNKNQISKWICSAEYKHENAFYVDVVNQFDQLHMVNLVSTLWSRANEWPLFNVVWYAGARE